MARYVANYTVKDEGRDKGKTFVITEMSAAQGEAWATRALLAIFADNGEVPENFKSMGAAELAAFGMSAFSNLKWSALEPLLKEMFDCIQIRPDKKKPQVVRELIEDDIEEILTRFNLRKEWWKLNLGFLEAVLPSLEELKKGTERPSPTQISAE